MNTPVLLKRICAELISTLSLLWADFTAYQWDTLSQPVLSDMQLVLSQTVYYHARLTGFVFGSCELKNLQFIDFLFLFLPQKGQMSERKSVTRSVEVAPCSPYSCVLFCVLVCVLLWMHEQGGLKDTRHELEFVVMMWWWWWWCECDILGLKNIFIYIRIQSVHVCKIYRWLKNAEKHVCAT